MSSGGHGQDEGWAGRLSWLPASWRGALEAARRSWRDYRVLLTAGLTVVMMLLLTGRISILSTLAGALAVAVVTARLPERSGSLLGQSSRIERSAPQRASAWRAMIDAYPDAAVVINGDGVVLHHNRLAHELIDNLAIGRDISAIRSPALNEAIERVSRRREAEQVQLLERIPIERRLLSVVSWVGEAAEPGPGDPAIVVLFRDLTEQDRLAQMRADFIANASHELRTPLASLRGFVETLQGPARNDPEAQKRFLSIMAEQATRMTRLIDDLLSLSRTEMRTHLPPGGICDLNEVAAHVQHALEPLAKEVNVTLTFKPLDRPARIRGDRDEIVQVLQNLGQNAIKYGPEKNGQVVMSVFREPAAGSAVSMVGVAVADNGPGIPPEHLPRLTERFYRVNVASSRAKGGTGLGLAIVKHIVNRHRGDLRIGSKVGSGSTFTVVFEELTSGKAQS